MRSSNAIQYDYIMQVTLETIYIYLFSQFYVFDGQPHLVTLILSKPRRV